MTILLTAALLGVFAILMLGWPRTGTAIVITVTMVWPAYIVIGAGSGPGINPQRLMIPIAIMIWLVHILAAPAYWRDLTAVLKTNRGFFLLLSAFFALGLVSGILSPYDKSQAVWGSLNQIMFMPVLMGLVLTYYRNPASIHKLIALLVVIALVAQAVGAIEWVRQEVVFNELVAPGSEHAEKILEGKARLDRHRVTSVFDNPLSYAQFLVFAAPLVMFQLGKTSNTFWRQLAWFQLLVIPVSVWTTGSRTGIALVVLSYFLGFMQWLRQCRISGQLRAVVTSILLATIMLAVATVIARLGVEGILGGSQSIESSTAARGYQLLRGIPAIAQSPFYGVGIHQGTVFMGGLTSIDNYYLTVVLEKGVIGLILLLGIQATVLRRLYISSNCDCKYDATVLARSLLISFSVLYLFEITLSVIEVFSISYVVFACFLVLNQIERSPEHS